MWKQDLRNLTTRYNVELAAAPIPVTRTKARVGRAALQQALQQALEVRLKNLGEGYSGQN